MNLLCSFFFFFFFNDTATTEIYTLSLHDALPIWAPPSARPAGCRRRRSCRGADRKSTRLNSSHQLISYAVFCLKKKKPGVLEHEPDMGAWLTLRDKPDRRLD